MLWIGTAVALFAGIVAAGILAKRSLGVDDLGSVSNHWIAEHRANYGSEIRRS
jgi:hypothetical protein